MDPFAEDHVGRHRDGEPETRERRPRRASRRPPPPDGVTDEPRVELTPEQKGRFLTDLESIVLDAERLMHRAKGQPERPSATVRDGLRATLRHARSTAADLDGDTRVQLQALGQIADDYVRLEPWRALGIAAGIGVIVGLLVTARRRPS